MIYLFPYEGLANRIRVISSAISLADYMDTDVLIVWKKDEALNADYESLFKKTKGIKTVRYSLFFKILFYTGSSPKISFIQKVFHKILHIKHFVSDNDIPALVWNNNYNLNLEQLGLKPKHNISTAFATCHDFFRFHDGLYKLMPVEGIVQFARKLIPKNENVIGLHIRRSDHVESKRYSPLQMFVERIEYEISQDSSIKFYLACDDNETIDFLIGEYPNRMIHFKKKFDRSVSKNIIDAFVDLWALSLCPIIYGSYFSSFSQIASKYNSSTLIILKAD